jgi:rare lipoprotein A (peptidoglycan hydrolase)
MVRGRVLDLSYKAPQEINMIAAGTTRVKIEFLTHRLTPSGFPQTASLASSLASTVGTVQPSWEPITSAAPPVVMWANTFLKAPHVVQTQQALAPGHVDVRVMTPSDNAPPWYRGRLGPLSNREDAEQKARQNIYQGYAAAVMAALRD